MEATMNPWLVIFVVLLVLFAWAWMFDRRRRRRGWVGDISVAARRKRSQEDATGSPPGGGF